MYLIQNIDLIKKFKCYLLQTPNFEFLWFLANHESVALLQWLNEEKTQKLLVDQLNTTEGKNFEYIIYYLIRTIKKLGENLQNRIQSCKQGLFLYTFYNPLKIALLTMELIQQTTEKVVHHKNKLNKAHEQYYKFAQIYCSLITDNQLLIELFKDVDLEKRKVIYLIDVHKSAVIASTQSVEDAIESMWNGNIAPKTNLLKMFTITQNLFFSELSDYILEKHPQKNEVFMALNENYKNHHFSLQRIVWTYNCRIRNQIDQCLILFMMTLILINFSTLFEPQYQLQKLLVESNYSYASILEQELALIQELQDVYFSFQIYIDIIIGFNFTFKPLFIFYYDWTQEIQTQFSIQDLLCFILGLFSIFQWIFIANAENVVEPYRFDVLVTFKWMYISLVIVQSVLSLRNFKIFGPMIKALWLVVLECSKFSFIFIVVILLFGFMAYFSFYENVNDRFKSLSQALLFLIEALFGQFSFADFSQPSPIYAPIFLNVYLFFSPIIFMQLLVAVLTFTFETASRSGRVHYFLSTIENLRNLEYDAICGCLVALPIVGNIFNVIFILTHMLSDPDPSLRVSLLFYIPKQLLTVSKIYLKQQEHNIDVLRKVNRVLVRLGYFPIYFVLTIICILMNLFFSPFFYIVKFFRILGETNKGEGYSKCKRVIKWVLFGFIYMIIQTVKDLIINYKYLMHGKFLNDSPQTNISNSTYQIIASIAKDQYLKLQKEKDKDKEKQIFNKMDFYEFMSIYIKKMKKEQEKQKKQGNSTQKKDGQNILSNLNLEKTDKTSSRFNQKIEGTSKIYRSNESQNSSKSSEEEQITRERNGQSIPKSQNHIDIYELSLSKRTSQLQQPQSATTKKDIQTLNMIKEISFDHVSNPTETKNSQKNNYFSNKIKSLLSHESEDVQSEEDLSGSSIKNKKKVQINYSQYLQPPQKHFTIRPIRAITASYISEQVTESSRQTQDDFTKRKSRQIEDGALFRQTIEQIKEQESQVKSRHDSKIEDFDTFQSKRNTNKFDDEDKANSIQQIPETKLEEEVEVDDYQSQKIYLEKLGSIGSGFQVNRTLTRDLKLQVLTHQQSSSSQAYETSMNRKRRKTALWKKLKKDDSNSAILKEAESLYSFLDAFVVDEEETQNNNNISELTKNEKEEPEQNEWIYIENLLKLMYHYSKNDVKLARFNILFQAIKKLFKDE